MENEIKKGWAILLPDKIIEHIPDLVISPWGVAEHLGIAADGQYIPKKRVTHDLSWPGKLSKQSINSGMNPDLLEPVMFGHCLLRTIHYIVNLRKHYPSSIIWLRKVDLKSAYRRLHLSALAAKKICSSSEDKRDLVSSYITSITFGGSSCPADFCLMSDIIAVTINDLLSCDCWDANSISSEFIDKIPSQQILNESIPFGQARDLNVDIPVDSWGKCDSYIDDFITCALDIGSNRERIIAAPCTVLHAISQKYSDKVHADRDDIICIDKAYAEGAAEEIKTINESLYE